MTLFASAFPLAAAVSILFLFIEGRADLFKLLYMYQRPKVRRYLFGITLIKLESPSWATTTIIIILKINVMRQCVYHCSAYEGHHK